MDDVSVPHNRGLRSISEGGVIPVEKALQWGKTKEGVEEAKYTAASNLLQ